MQAINDLLTGKNHRLFANSRHGIEREFLRADEKGCLATTPHPVRLGSALTNQHITTDFCEAQPELVTSAAMSDTALMNDLNDLHIFAQNGLDHQELIWPFSMPCVLPEENKIPLAQYGNSNEGTAKTVYRRGLGLRYGRKMQTISGVHYNFSFSDRLLDFLYKKSKFHADRQAFINDAYFGVIRNFLRHRCILTYLFGASPAIHNSYLHTTRPSFLKRLNKATLYGEYATSLRTSTLGYYSKIQSQIGVSYRDMDTYLKDLTHAVSTTHPDYAKIGLSNGKQHLQLNDHYLQIPNEHYTSIRPKQPLKEGENAIDALRARGVKYIEIRSLDLDPFSPTGVNHEALRFIQILLTYCLLLPSPKFTKQNRKNIMACQDRVALFGRDPGLMLNHDGKPIHFHSFGMDFLKKLEPIAALLDKNFHDQRYSKSLNEQIRKFQDPSCTPSARIIREMREHNECFIDMGTRLANEHRYSLQQLQLSDKKLEALTREATGSLIRQKNLEIKSEIFLSGYEDMEGSTQLLIREALCREIKVEVLDRAANFIRLKKGKKVEYVKQGNKTSRDSYITFLLMENKHITKLMLEENGIHVPVGDLYHDPQKALADYHLYKKIKCVIKPNDTNFGIGVHFVEPNDPASFEKAVSETFRHSKSIVVEEFFDGKEYRFLVIGEKVSAIVHRRPANVIGDGVHTVRELIKSKNEDPQMFKNNTGYIIRTGKEEAQMLRSQRLTFSSVPRRGEMIFLRQNSNLHTGGDAIDFTDEMHRSYKEIAVRAAQAVGAKICGVDMIVKDLNVKARHRNHVIIELNFNPAMQMHDFNINGKNRKVERDVLDLLGF